MAHLVHVVELVLEFPVVLVVTTWRVANHAFGGSFLGTVIYGACWVAIFVVGRALFELVGETRSKRHLRATPKYGPDARDWPTNYGGD